MELVRRAADFGQNTAIVSNDSSYSYAELLKFSANIAANILKGKADLSESRIAFLVSPSFEYVATQWGIWRAGGIAVPLCVKHPLPSMEYVLMDTDASMIIADKDCVNFIRPLAAKCNIPLYNYDELRSEQNTTLPDIELERRAMILYTSGTTSKPKGVVSQHRHVQAQIETLVKAWEWEEKDRILNVLPLHHVHGIINVLTCALWSGASCEFLPGFDPGRVWERIASGDLSLFMGVPTMYYQLISRWESCTNEEQKQMSEAASQLRLMVSGSAALPVPVLEKWRSITNHTLLERYGMTEIGMGLSNPYRGERRPGHVGLPLEGVELVLLNEDKEVVNEGEAGEIHVKGPSVFEEYWNKPEATSEAFTEEGWFKTGDIAVFNKGSYKILGRDNLDIIKSGGYKISALEIEDELRNHKHIDDCAVVGIPDPEWGEVVAAALISDEDIPDFESITISLKEKLPSYKLPRKYIVVKKLPRNVLGKVTKAELKELFH